jgi:hypothetical protein
MRDASIDLRLTDPALDFWVDVRMRRIGHAWVAAAVLASTREIAAAFRPDIALLFALWPLGAEAAVRIASQLDIDAATDLALEGLRR